MRTGINAHIRYPFLDYSFEFSGFNSDFKGSFAVRADMGSLPSSLQFSFITGRYCLGESNFLLLRVRKILSPWTVSQQRKSRNISVYTIFSGLFSRISIIMIIAEKNITEVREISRTLILMNLKKLNLFLDFEGIISVTAEIIQTTSIKTSTPKIILLIN